MRTRLTDLQRFAAHFIVRPRTRCWIWIGAKSYGISGKAADPYGYFRFRGKQWMAHRASYELHVGQIPKDMQLDHQCRHTLCVNPEHLEAVTPRENVRRGYALKPLVMACRHGHDYTPENTYWKRRPGGTVTRECRACRKDQLNALYERRRLAA